MLILQDIPLEICSNIDFTSLYSIEACAVAVVYIIYDKKKKNIVKMGTSRACGDNHIKSSIHAEEICINYCRSNDKRNKYEIYIWRYSKSGEIKPVYCCCACSQLLKKYNYYHKIYTFDNCNILSVYHKTYITIGFIIKHWL